MAFKNSGGISTDTHLPFANGWRRRFRRKGFSRHVGDYRIVQHPPSLPYLRNSASIFTHWSWSGSILWKVWILNLGGDFPFSRNFRRIEKEEQREWCLLTEGVSLLRCCVIGKFWLFEGNHSFVVLKSESTSTYLFEF